MKKSSISSTDPRVGILTGRMTQTVTHQRSAISPTKCQKLFYIHNFFLAPLHKLIRLGSLPTFSSDNDAAETPVASLRNVPAGLCCCVSVIKPTFEKQWFNLQIKHWNTSRSDPLSKRILIVNLTKLLVSCRLAYRVPTKVTILVFVIVIVWSLNLQIYISYQHHQSFNYM